MESCFILSGLGSGGSGLLHSGWSFGSCPLALLWSREQRVSELVELTQSLPDQRPWDSGVRVGMEGRAWVSQGLPDGTESLNLDTSSALSLSRVVERDAGEKVVSELHKRYDTLTVLVTNVSLFHKASARQREPQLLFYWGNPGSGCNDPASVATMLYGWGAAPRRWWAVIQAAWSRRF